MSHTFFVSLVIITTYHVSSLAKTETLEIKKPFSKQFNNSLYSLNRKYQVDTWIPTNLATIVLVIATISLSFKLTYEGNYFSIYGKSRNLGVVHGRVILPWRLPIIDQIYSSIYLRVGM